MFSYYLCILRIRVPFQGSKHPIILFTDHTPILFLFTQKNKPNQGDFKFQLIFMKFPNLHIVWTEGKNFSYADLLRRSLTNTTLDEHRLRTVEIPDSIKFFMTHKQNTQPKQCHYAVSKEYIILRSTDTHVESPHVESPHFPISLQIKDNYFKVQLENDLYLPVSYYEFQAKALPLDDTHQQKIQQFKNNYSLPEIYLIIHHRDITLNTNKTEPLTQFNHDANYAELINIIKISLPAMDDFIPKFLILHNHFYEEQAEINDMLPYETQQQDPVLRHLLLWKSHKNPPPLH